MSGKVQRVMQGAMTVADLKSELETCEDDSPVLFVCDYGDHCHTQQALQVKHVQTHDSENFDESAYSQSGIKFDEDNPREELDDGEEDKTVVILSAAML